MHLKLLILHTLCIIFHINYLQIPRSEPEWLQSASDFEDQLNVCNFIGALDGKHINGHPQIVYHITTNTNLALFSCSLLTQIHHTGSHMWT